MTDYHISLAPPPDWQPGGQAGGELFHGSEWAAVLQQGFKAPTVYARDSDGGGVALTIFSAGPFRVAYAGFPVGASLPAEKAAALVSADFPLSIHLIRLVVSGFGSADRLPFRGVQNPETAIENLSAWRLEALSDSVARNVRKAERSGVQVADLEDPTRAGRLYELYRDTVKRHRGGMRYTPAYFEALISLCTRSATLRCLVAQVDGSIVAFLVVACDGSSAYYLHGATDMRYQDRRPSDLLFASAIKWAQDRGISVFNLMASPTGQDSLVRFKEKWGGSTRLQTTYDLPVRKLPAKLFALAAPLYRVLTAGRG